MLRRARNNPAIVSCSVAVQVARRGYTVMALGAGQTTAAVLSLRCLARILREPYGDTCSGPRHAVVALAAVRMATAMLDGRCRARLLRTLIAVQ